jgi:hypothetical protein
MMWAQLVSLYKNIMGIPEIKIKDSGNGRIRVTANQAAVRRAKLDSIERCNGPRMRQCISNTTMIKKNEVNRKHYIFGGTDEEICRNNNRH